MNLGRQLTRIVGAAIVLIAAALAPSLGQAHEGHARAHLASVAQGRAAEAGAVLASPAAIPNDLTISSDLMLRCEAKPSLEARTIGTLHRQGASFEAQPSASHLRMRDGGEGATLLAIGSAEPETSAPLGCERHCCGAGAACCAPALAPALAGLGPTTLSARAAPLRAARHPPGVDPEALPEPPRPIA